MIPLIRNHKSAESLNRWRHSNITGGKQKSIFNEYKKSFTLTIMQYRDLVIFSVSVPAKISLVMI